MIGILANPRLLSVVAGALALALAVGYLYTLRAENARLRASLTAAEASLQAYEQQAADRARAETAAAADARAATVRRQRLSRDQAAVQAAPEPIQEALRRMRR